jgi:hypothetical protein
MRPDTQTRNKYEDSRYYTAYLFDCPAASSIVVADTKQGASTSSFAIARPLADLLCPHSFSVTDPWKHGLFDEHDGWLPYWK